MSKNLNFHGLKLDGWLFNCDIFILIPAVIINRLD